MYDYNFNLLKKHSITSIFPDENEIIQGVLFLTVLIATFIMKILVLPDI